MRAHIVQRGPVDLSGTPRPESPAASQCRCDVHDFTYCARTISPILLLVRCSYSYESIFLRVTMSDALTMFDFAFADKLLVKEAELHTFADDLQRPQTIRRAALRQAATGLWVHALAHAGGVVAHCLHTLYFLNRQSCLICTLINRGWDNGCRRRVQA